MKTFFRIFELLSKFLSAPGLAWQAALKKTKVELELLTNIDMLLMVEKRMRKGKYYPINWYAKANNKYIKGCDKKKSLYLKYWDVNNLIYIVRQCRESY